MLFPRPEVLRPAQHRLQSGCLGDQEGLSAFQRVRKRLPNEALKALRPRTCCREEKKAQKLGVADAALAAGDLLSRAIEDRSGVLSFIRRTRRKVPFGMEGMSVDTPCESPRRCLPIDAPTIQYAYYL